MQKGYYRFQKADSTGLFYTTGRGEVNFRISASERTVKEMAEHLAIRLRKGKKLAGGLSLWVRHLSVFLSYLMILY